MLKLFIKFSAQKFIEINTKLKSLQTYFNLHSSIKVETFETNIFIIP